MKAIRIWIIIMAIVIIFSAIIIYKEQVKNGPPMINDLPMINTASEQYYHYSNNYQFESGIWIGEYHGLWFLLKGCELYQMENDGYKSLYSFQSRPKIIGQVDQYLLYSIKTSWDDDIESSILYCYNLLDNTNTVLSDNLKRRLVVNGNRATFGMDFLLENGTAFIVTQLDSGSGYYRFGQGKLEESTCSTVGFSVGDTMYTVLAAKREAKVYRVHNGSEKEELLLPSATRYTIIPAYHGLIIHTEWTGHFLWYIDEHNRLSEIFSVDCMFSQSCVAVHENYVFLSFMRWEKYKDIFAVRFENDMLEGTWRIDLRDFSAEKISEEIYDGMFIYDDSTICAVKEGGSIDQISFTGELKQIITKGR